MTDQIERLTQQIAELQDTVKGRAQDATIDWDTVTEKFSEQIEALTSEQVKQELDKRPVRRIPGEYIGEDGDVHNLSEMKSNRYFPYLKGFQTDGYFKAFNKKIVPADLWYAHKLLEGQHAKHSAQIGGRALPPSDDLNAALKALTSEGSGSGDELVPTIMASTLWEDFFLASKLVADLGPIPQPSNPFDLPLGLGDVTWRKGSEGTATTHSDPTTAKSTLTATELITEQRWSYTLEEDAIIALAPALRARLAQSGGEIMDDFLLNADATDAGTGNINLDDADPDADTYYLSEGQDGIRHQFLVNNTDQGVNAGGDALTDTDILNGIKLMGKYAVDPSKLRMVPDVQTYLKALLGLDGVSTIDKFGANAVLVKGQLASYRGIPILVSASMRKTEADGKRSTTEASNTLGQIAFYNTNNWVVGFIRDLMIEVDRNILTRQYIMVTSLRQAVACHGTRSSATHTSGIYNILV